MGTDANALVRRVRFRCWLSVASSGSVTALFLLPGLVSTWPVFFPGVPMRRALLLECALAIPYLALANVTSWWFFVPRTLDPALEWLREGRPATPAERQLVATQPRRQANVPLLYWIVFVIVIFPYTLAIGIPLTTATAIKTFEAMVFIATIGWTLSYLLVERTMRPVLTLAMEGAPSAEPRTMGVFRRLLLAWAVAAGLPLWHLMVVLYGLTPTQRELALPFVYLLSSVSIVSGVIAMVVASRAITDPLEKVRGGMRSVEQGDFGVDVAIDEASEIGVLQMGFNRMVSGLRERERMREVFGRHVGPDVARLAMERDFAHRGEVCEATAMFVDVIGSTGLAQRTDPDVVVETLNRFFDAVVRAVEAEGGFVNKFQGDGALCIFGAPIAQTDHAARALRAAQGLRRELRPLAETLDAAIGISSGNVVAGNVGAANRYEYTVIGDPVNEAARLTEEAKSRLGRVLASDTTLRDAGSEAANWTAAGSISLRGRADPTIAFEPSPA